MDCADPGLGNYRMAHNTGLATIRNSMAIVRTSMIPIGTLVVKLREKTCTWMSH